MQLKKIITNLFILISTTTAIFYNTILSIIFLWTIKSDWWFLKSLFEFRLHLQLGVNVRIMKMDFITGGTWRRVEQWTPMLKIFSRLLLKRRLYILLSSFFFFFLSTIYNLPIFLFSTKVLILIFSDLVQRSYE